MSYFKGHFVCWILWVLSALGPQAFAGEHGPERRACWEPRGGEGGTIPIPFDEVNRRVELAADEYYQLSGVVQEFNGNHYLTVDLDVHGWLANKKRVNAPYYMIENHEFDLTHYEGRRVSAFFKAKGRMISFADGPAYRINLVLLARPTTLK